ncbi:MAG: protein translocase subunit SecD [Desulfobacterales bacterium]|nr:protein translocase subunit SecD [Desulfobacterales bacterium]
MKELSFKLVISIVIMVLGIIYIVPTIKPGIWPYKKINLGLDLQGGMHLILEVDANKAVENSLGRTVEDIRNSLKKENIANFELNRIEGIKISLKLTSSADKDKFEKILDKEFPEVRIISRAIADSITTVLMGLPDKEIERIKKLSTEQALETIRNRIDQFGVSEPDIRIRGENQILVQLPGVKDVERAKALIGKTAILEFKLVDDEHDLNAAIKGDVPSGSEILYQSLEDRETNRTKKTPFLLKKQALLSGSYLTDARVQFDSQYNEPYVSIDFDKKGARLFERITEENVHKRLAIVLDQTVYSAPVIQEKISGGAARITGSFTPDEARDLAIVLRAGALPAPVTIAEERTVGPSLGTDSITKGILSMIVGTILIFLYMMIYYKGSGLIADVAVLFNIILICAGLAMLQATLTLPGMAGIVLTIGMAVDANVLIFERIREELIVGKSVRAAINAGYDRASIAILDSNIATLIAALVLFQFGTGTIKGFAVTLSLGIVASLFTALIITRLIFDLIMNKWNVKQLSI